MELSIEGVPEDCVRGIRYDEKCIMRQYRLSTDQIIRVEIIPCKTRAKRYFRAREYLSVFVEPTFITFFFILSLSLRERVFSSFSLNRPTSLSSHLVQNTFSSWIELMLRYIHGFGTSGSMVLAWKQL